MRFQYFGYWSESSSVQHLHIDRKGIKVTVDVPFFVR